MAAPYSNVNAADDRDHYNFYHSQLRINIECAFGILVNRWGILRRPMPSNYSIRKIADIVNCLCRLHNFLIDARLERSNTPTVAADDALFLRMNGGFETSEHTVEELGTVALPDEATGGGEHFDDDHGQAMRREIARQNPTELPRERLYNRIRESDSRRPSRRTY